MNEPVFTYVDEVQANGMRHFVITAPDGFVCLDFTYDPDKPDISNSEVFANYLRIAEHYQAGALS